MLTLGGVTTSAQHKTCWLHLRAQFATESDEIWCGVEAVQLNILKQFLTEINVKREITEFTDCRKNVHFGRRSNVWERIWCNDRYY